MSRLAYILYAGVVVAVVTLINLVGEANGGYASRGWSSGGSSVGGGWSSGGGGHK